MLQKRGEILAFKHYLMFSSSQDYFASSNYKCMIIVSGEGGGGDSHMKEARMLVGNFELNP